MCPMLNTKKILSEHLSKWEEKQNKTKTKQMCMFGGVSKFLCCSVWWVESKSVACFNSLCLDFDLGRCLSFESSRKLIFFCLAFHHWLTKQVLQQNIFFVYLITCIFVATGFLKYLTSFYNSYLLPFYWVNHQKPNIRGNV